MGELPAQDPADLKFDVKWIGFWFNIPGQTLDPTQVTNEFFDSGADVVISGIDTTEALVRAGQRAAAGDKVWAIPYDFKGAIAEAPEVALGVPYFNWGPAYLKVVQSVIDGTFKATFEWNGPIGRTSTTPTPARWVREGSGAVAAELRDARSVHRGTRRRVDQLVHGAAQLAGREPFLASGQKASDVQIWYAQQLLQGMTGAADPDRRDEGARR